MSTKEIAEQYLAFKKGRYNDQFKTIDYCIESLKDAVEIAGGNSDFFHLEHLANITALELIAHLAPNGIRFTNDGLERDYHDDIKTLWNLAPSWAKWLAKDESDKWYWYEGKPEFDDEEWMIPDDNHNDDAENVSDCVLGYIARLPYANWKDSLMERPKEEGSGANDLEEDAITTLWNLAPEWAKWLAKDKNNEWYWHEGKPVMSSYQWMTPRHEKVKNDLMPYIASFFDVDWKESLMMRA